MAVPWRQVCYVMMAVNAVLMVATLTVAVVSFSQPRVPPPSCQPGPATASSTAGDVIDRTLETVRQAVQERDNNKQAAEYYKTKKPRGLKPHAHLVLNRPQNFKADKNLLWDASHNRSILQGFQYDQRGYLRVPEDGHYFIYLHLQYMEKPALGFDRDKLKDYIYRTEKRFVEDPALRDRMKRKLLFNEQTPCKVVSPAIPLPSSYQGAVVILNRDDMLHVASILPENLHNEVALSNFGVYLV